MQRKQISFEGQRIFIGIDVHKRNWSVAVSTETGCVRTHSQKASAQTLLDFLQGNYPGADYVAVYEAGFTGFSTYYALSDLGIKCLVIHAADVPTTQYENVMKTDRIDAVKLVKALRAGLLRGIYVRPKQSVDDIGVVRIRQCVLRDQNRYKVRIKHKLMTNGVEMPECFEGPRGARWSRVFINWLKQDATLMSGTRTSMDLLISQLERMRSAQLEANRELRRLSQTERYRQGHDLLCSIPGIGTVVAMTILTEVCDITRFSNERQFASWMGLVPTCHSSGEKVSHGEKTFRGNKQLGPALIEASWVAIKTDAGLAAAFGSLCRRMKRQEAIVRIARKLSNIIFAVLKNRTRYVPYVFNA